MKRYVQQIMLGTVTGNRQQAMEALGRIRKAGYDGLELNRFMIHPASFMVRTMTRMAGMPTGKGGNLDWKGMLEDSGLSVASLHADLGSLEREPEAVAEEAHSFGTDRIVITGMYRFDYGSPDAVKILTERLNKVGAEMKAKGLKLLYHNHNIELQRLNDGKAAYELILEGTEEDLVGFEFDSFWFTEGGADAKQWMKRLSRRMSMWHVTDRGFRQAGPSMTPIMKSDSMELGSGNMDLRGLYEIALSNGVDAIVLESHRNWIGNDPLKSMEISAKWLKEVSE